MRKVLCFLLAACVLLTAAGCNGGNAPLGSANSLGEAGTTQNPAQDSAETAQAGPGEISVRCTTVSLDWKFIGGFNEQQRRDSKFIEDGQGTLHMIYADETNNTCHCFQKADGSWSEPQQIADRSIDWEGTAPDGSLCVAWIERVHEPQKIDNDVLHMKFYQNGQWREGSKTYDFNGDPDLCGFDIQWVQVAFDARGEPHFLYSVTLYFELEGSSAYHHLYGLFLDDQAFLLSEVDDDSTMASQVKGVGVLERVVHFMIDSGNVYHLMGFDETSQLPAEVYPVYTRYVHSYSRDGGVTWEGPFAVLEDESGISHNEVSITEDPDGSLRLTAQYPNSDRRHLTTTRRPGSLDFGTPEEYYNYRQFFDGLETLPYEEAAKYGLDQTGFLWAVLFDGKGGTHYITERFWDKTQVSDNTWALREIKKPEEDARPATIFLRRNGNFALFMETGDKLYYAEISAEG